MAMGRRTGKQRGMWVSTSDVADAPGHRFYEKLNGLLKEHDFDRRVESLCERFYEAAGTAGRPSVPPGVYFRMLLVGYFEGIESERGICWRCSDSLSLRSFLGLELTEPVPDQSTLSRTRQRFELEVFDGVFELVLDIVRSSGLLKGKVVGVDSTYLRADASMKAIVRRDTGQVYGDYIKNLAKEDGVEEPTAEDARRMDRQRPKKTSNKDWRSSTDSDARIARLKDGRTRLAYKAEHTVDMETGAIIDAAIHPADQSDSATLSEAAERARNRIHGSEAGDEENDDQDPPSGSTSSAASLLPPSPVISLVADKGYHKASLLRDLQEAGFRTYIPERKQRGNRRWTDKGGQRTADAFHANRARVGRAKGKRYQRLRGERIERTFAHSCETGAHRRTRLRGRENVAKRYVIHASAQNLGLVMRKLFGKGTPRGLALAFRALFEAVSRVSDHLVAIWTVLNITVARNHRHDHLRQSPAG